MKLPRVAFIRPSGLSEHIFDCELISLDPKSKDLLSLPAVSLLQPHIHVHHFITPQQAQPFFRKYISRTTFCHLYYNDVSYFVVIVLLHWEHQWTSGLTALRTLSVFIYFY